MFLKPVALNKSHRLINHGAITMISASHQQIENVMSASWVCPLNFSPPTVTVVLDKSTFTRTLIEQSGYFAIQLPFAKQAPLVLQMGNSRHNHPNKLADYGVKLFYQAGFAVPLVADCAGYLICKTIEDRHNQQTHDLFIGEIVSAWADERVFQNDHWQFDQVPDDLKTLHYVSGGQFYLTGKGLKIG